MNTQKANLPGMAGAKRTYQGTIMKPHSRDEVKQAAQGRWRDILVSLGVPLECLSGRHCWCPACGGKDRFRFDDKNGSGSFYCNNCGAGDGFELLKRFHGWDFRTALSRVADVLSLQSIKLERVNTVTTKNLGTPRAPDTKAVKYNNWLWSSSKPLTEGCIADRYLKERGIDLSSFPDCLRCHEGIDYVDKDEPRGKFPAMVAEVLSPSGERVAIHRTYLSSEGKKAPVKRSKKLSKALFPGATRGGAIRLFPAGEKLALAEGIETALSCHILWGVPAWATISSTMLKAVVIPDCVEHVVIAVDNDSHKTDAGLKASQELAERMKSEGRTYQLVMPDTAGRDLNDILKELN